MSRSDPPDIGEHADIRWLVASDPKRARQHFQRLLTEGGEPVRRFLSTASRPGDGRLRQMVATVYRTEPAASILEAWLTEWLAVETDEFTRTAVENALASRAPTPVRQRGSRGSPEQIVEAYRFVSDRLCHRIRNAMALPNAQLKRLTELIDQLPETNHRTDLQETVVAIQGGFVKIARNVEFNTDDHYLEWDAIAPIEWLSANERSLRERFGSARLVIRGHNTVRHARVRATPFLLETLFGNLWTNAVQASESPRSLELECAVDAPKREVLMVILDSGPGFSDAHLDDAFRQMFSTKGQSRGRGLLEIADAVARLQGAVSFVRRGEGDHRVSITLPLDGG